MSKTLEALANKIRRQNPKLFSYGVRLQVTYDFKENYGGAGQLVGFEPFTIKLSGEHQLLGRGFSEAQAINDLERQLLTPGTLPVGDEEL